MKQFIYIALISILLVAVPVAAKTSAKEAAEQSLAAVTIFMDVNKLTRKNIAAKNMTESHQDFATYGYELVGVSIYTENGDLEGFFVSYKKK